jgi:hypothetical protein
VEFCEDVRQLLVGDVDHRVPRTDSAEVAVGEIQAGHRADLKAQVGVATSRLGKHLGRQVDTENVES